MAPRREIGPARVLFGPLLIVAALAAPAPPASGHGEGAPDVDLSERQPTVRPGPATARAQRSLRRSLGEEGVVRLHARTGAPRAVARRDGFLTAPSRRDPADVALGFVRQHSSAFGLDRDDLASLRLVDRTPLPGGGVSIEWRQTYGGVPALDAALRASVSARGRLVNVVGAPRPDLHASTTRPRLSAAEASRAAVAATARPGRPGGRPRLVLFEQPGGARPAWRVLVLSADGHAYDSVVDALDGRLLRRRDLLLEASGDVFRNRPGAASGGTQQSVAFSTSGADPWVTNFTRLEGDNGIAYSDPGDSIYSSLSGTEPFPAPAAGDHVAPNSGGGTSSAAWTAAQVTEGATSPGQTCPAAGCSWNGFAPGFSWTVNRAQAATQVFYFVNNFHDHLRDDPGIAFDDASGNFEETGGGVAGDPVHAQVDDGANLSGGFPDCADHVNNADIVVLPDGYSPRIQTYLFTASCGDPGVHEVNSADDAFVVYHEYGHGLSGRLVTDADGYPALWSHQPGALGEAWSDWYAMDYLVEQGLETDGALDGDLPNTPYFGVKFRTESMDCPIGSGPPRCPGTSGAGAGGYTYGDFGRILGYPEVHADGEIWGQTLWDLRKRLLQDHPADGVFRTRALVTDAMRLSPPEPSFLEMRDAILQANTARGFGDSQAIWQVFAARGMGVCASTSGPGDTNPQQNFQTPGATCPSPPQGEVSVAPPASPPSSTPQKPRPASTPPKPAAPSLTIGGGAVPVDRAGRFSYSVRSVAGASGAVTVRPLSKAGRRALRALARRSFKVPASGRVTVRLRLPSATRRLLRKRRRLRVRVTVTVTTRGLTSRSSAVLTLRAAR